MSAVRPAAVGDIYRGITGNRMEVLAIDGGMVQLGYVGESYGEEPWWDDADEVARYLDLEVVEHDEGASGRCARGLCGSVRLTRFGPSPAASSGDLPSPSPWGSDKGGER